MKKTISLIICLTMTACMPDVYAETVQDPPEPQGFLNPKIKQSNIQRTVCVPNFTDTIRPSSYYTNKLKAKQLRDLHIDDDPDLFEEDHFISLALGGHPTDARNLFPQRWEGRYGAREKDKLEKRLHNLLCKKRSISLKTAQACIVKWRQCWNTYMDDPL